MNAPDTSSASIAETIEARCAALMKRAGELAAEHGGALREHTRLREALALLTGRTKGAAARQRLRPAKRSPSHRYDGSRRAAVLRIAAQRETFMVRGLHPSADRLDVNNTRIGGLVRVRETVANGYGRGANVYEITDAGREWLAEYDARTSTNGGAL